MCTSCLYSVVVHNSETIPHSQLSDLEATLTPSNPDIKDINPSECKKKRMAKKKKRDVTNLHSLSSTVPGADHTPSLLLNKSSTESAKSEISRSQCVRMSPPHGCKREHDGSLNPPTQLCDRISNGAVCGFKHINQPSEVCSSAEQVPISPLNQASTAGFRSPIYPTAPTLLHNTDSVSFAEARSCPDAFMFSSQPPTPLPDTSMSSPHAPVSPINVSISSPIVPVSPPAFIISSPKVPVSPPNAFASSLAPIALPLTKDDLQSNLKRKRKSTDALAENGCEKHSATEEEQKEPLPKRVRRATYSISPKITSNKEKEVHTSDENISDNVEVCDAQALSSIMDVHSEIVALLDKRVEKIRKLYKVHILGYFTCTCCLAEHFVQKS